MSAEALSTVFGGAGGAMLVASSCQNVKAFTSVSRAKRKTVPTQTNVETAAARQRDQTNRPLGAGSRLHRADNAQQ